MGALCSRGRRVLRCGEAADRPGSSASCVRLQAAVLPHHPGGEGAAAEADRSSWLEQSDGALRPEQTAD